MGHGKLCCIVKQISVSVAVSRLDASAAAKPDARDVTIFLLALSELIYAMPPCCFLTMLFVQSADVIMTGNTWHRNFSEIPGAANQFPPSFLNWNRRTEHCHHRRWIKTEEKANIVASVCGEEYIQFLVALAILPNTILKNWNSSFSFKSSCCKSS